MSEMPEQQLQHHLDVGTEVSAKYRGAFCEARIKSVKKLVIFHVKSVSKHQPKSCGLTEDCVKGKLKVGSYVEARFPEQTAWTEGYITNIKDKSTYTVEFDDGDIRSLPRNFLCLQGVRHYPESDTLDHLPLTDPENFGTPVLSTKRKPKRKQTSFGKSFFTNADSDDQRSIPPSPKRKSTTTSKNTSNEEVEEEDEQETAESKEAIRERWLDDKMLGKLIFAVNGKKKFPAVVVNPMIRSDFASVAEGQVMVRSFINGKFSIVQRSTVLTKANIPTSGGKVTDSQIREAAKDAFIWESSGKPPECWKTEVVTSLVPDDVSDDEDDDVCGDDDDTSSKSSASKLEEEDEDKEEKKLKNQLFLEQLYKFMEDIGTPITKTPVLGYKDLDLYMLYNLVQTRGGSHAMTKSVEWREVYSGLKIPKHNSAGSHHVKQAFNKYLLRFEEYLISFKNTPFNQQIKKAAATETIVPTTPKKSTTTTTTIDNIDNSSVDSSSSTTSSLVRRTSRRRKASESAIPDIDNIDTKDTKPTIRKSKGGGANDGDDSSGSKSSTGSKTEGKAKLMKKRRASHASSTSSSSSQTKKPKYNINDILLIRYKVETDDSYEAKVTKITGGGDDERYFVHYPGWNTRFDEWVEVNRIVGYAREGGSGGEPNKANRRPRPNFDNAGDSPTVVKEEAVETTTPTTTPKPVKKENQKSSSSSSSVVGTECTKKSTTPSRQRRGSTSSAPMAQIEYIGKEGADSLEKRAASEEKTLNVAAGRIKGKNLKRPPSVISEIEEKKTSVNPTPVLKIEPPDDPTPVVAIPVPGRRTSGRPSIPPSYHQDSVRFPIKRRPRGARVTTSGTTTTTKSTVPCTSIDLPKKSSITPTVRDPTSTATTTTTMTNIKPFPTSSSSSSSSAATNVVEDTKPILPLSTTTTPQCGATTSTGSGQRFKRRSPPPTAVVQPTPVQSTSMFGTISDILASELADLQGAKNNSPQQQEEELSCQEGEEEPHRVEPGASEEEEAVSSNIYDFTSSSPSPSPAQAPPPPSQPPTTLSQTSIVTSQKTDDDDDDMDDMMDDIDDMMNSSVGSSLSSQQDDDEEETPSNSCSTNNKDSTTTTITITPPDEATKVLLPVTSTSTLYAAVVTSSSSCTETSPSSSPSTTTTNNPPTTTTTTTTEVTTPDDVEMREVESSGDANNNGNSTSTSSSNEAHSNFSSPDQKEEDDEENNKTQNNHNNSSSPNKQSNSNDNNKHDNQKQKKNTKGVKRKRQSNHQQEKDNGGNSESGGEDNNKSASRRKRRSNKKKKTANVTDKTSAVPPVPNIPPEDELQKLSPDEIISRLSDQKMCLRKVWQQCRLEVQRLDRKRKRYKRLQEEENASDNKKLFSPTKRDNSVVDCAA